MIALSALTRYLNDAIDEQNLAALVESTLQEYDNTLLSLHQMGKYLLECQNLVKHGMFDEFLFEQFESKVGLSGRTAYRWIAVARRFPNELPPNAGKVVLYLLSADSTPLAAVNEIVTLPRIPTIAEAHMIVKHHQSSLESITEKGKGELEAALAESEIEVQTVALKHHCSNRDVIPILSRYFANCPAQFKDIEESGLLTWEGEKNANKPSVHLSRIDAPTAEKIYNSVRTEQSMSDDEADSPVKHMVALCEVGELKRTEQGFYMLEIRIPESAVHAVDALRGTHQKVTIQAPV
jgi:hypothetical protein